MAENKTVITWSLIILFLILSITYSLAYMKNVTLFKNGITTNNIESNSGEINDLNDQITTNSIDLSDTDTDNVIDLGGLELSGVNNSYTQAPDRTESSTSDRLASTNSKMLSGTTEYFGVLDIVSMLGVQPQFTLQDSSGDYFVYYGEHLDFVQTVQLLGGNVYQMVTETEILQNQLFGDKVSYINLSSFKDSRVLMVIEIDNDVWLIQVPANKYHYSKDYLKSLFIQ